MELVYNLRVMSIKKLGIDIGSTTIKVAVLDENEELLFADYKRHYANIQSTLAELIKEINETLGQIQR